MAEYIDRTELAVTPIDITDLPRDKCLMVYLAEDVDSLPTADVVERSEYEKIKIERDISAQRIHDLGKSVSKAIEEIDELKTAHCIQVMDREDIVMTCLEILKRNIGE